MMTDNEIIKALGCCIEHKCHKCPARAMFCSESIPMAFAIDLITRQKAEIERLTHNIEAMAQTMPNMAKAERAEAVKEFAERLKDKSKKRTQDVYGERVFLGDIDSLVKEMVGEDKVQWPKQGECPITAEQFNAIYDDEEMVGDV